MNEAEETLCEKPMGGTKIQCLKETLGQDGLAPPSASEKINPLRLGDTPAHAHRL